MTKSTYGWFIYLLHSGLKENYFLKRLQMICSHLRDRKNAHLYRLRKFQIIFRQKTMPMSLTLSPVKLLEIPNLDNHSSLSILAATPLWVQILTFNKESA